MSETSTSSAPIPRLCPVCGSDQASDYLRKGQLRLVRCERCSMIYANPVAPEFASAQFYHREAADYYLSPEKLESDYADVRFERELRIFRKFCSSGKVLDVGCSSGAFLYQLQKRFPGAYEVLGTDASGPALDYAEKMEIPVVRGDFLQQDFGSRRFDAVSFWAVLEHLLQPEAFLRKAATLLAERGLCFVLVPNLRSLATRLLGARYRYILPQHLNYFTRRTLEALASRWFHVVEFHSTHFNPMVIWQDWIRTGREVSDQQRASLLRRTTAYKQSVTLKPARWVYSFTERLLGAVQLADNLLLVLRPKA